MAYVIVPDPFSACLWCESRKRVWPCETSMELQQQLVNMRHHVATKDEIIGDEDVRGCEKVNKIWSLMSCLTKIKVVHIAMYLSLHS